MHKHLTPKARTKTISALADFLNDKDTGGMVISECIQTYTEAEMSNEHLAVLRTELKSIREAADFALRQLRNI